MSSTPKNNTLIQVADIKGWAVQPMKGKDRTALIFDLPGGPFGVAISNEDMANFSESIHGEAAKLTAPAD